MILSPLTDLLLFNLIVGADMMAYVLILPAGRVDFGEINAVRGRAWRIDDAMEDCLRQAEELLKKRG